MVKHMRVVVKETKEVRELKELKVDIGRDGKEYYLTIIPNTEIVDPISKSLCTPLIEQITSLDEYQKLAARTLPDLTEFYGGTIMIDNLPEDANIVHCMYGVDTELGEILDLYKKSFAYRKPFDRTNLLEEVCDIMWYLAAGCTVSEIKISSFINDLNFHGSLIPSRDYPNLSIMAALYNLIKGYRRGGVLIENLLASLVSSKAELFRGLTNNINKLIIRYPDKFSNEAAINRDLDSERKELEK